MKASVAAVSTLILFLNQSLTVNRKNFGFFKGIFNCDFFTEAIRQLLLLHPTSTEKCFIQPTFSARGCVLIVPKLCTVDLENCCNLSDMINSE